MEDIYRIWLGQLSVMVSGTVRAEFVVEPGERESFRYVLNWPDDNSTIAAAERIISAVSSSQSAIIKPNESSCGESGEPHDVLGCPVIICGHFLGVVVVEITGRSQQMRQSAAQLVQNSIKWLEVLLQQQQGSSQAHLAYLVSLVSIALEPIELSQSLTQLVNAVSLRYDCLRVSIGFVTKGEVEVVAISQTLAVEVDLNEARAIRDAMGEACDQSAVIVWPIANSSDFQLTKFHHVLSEQSLGNVTIVSLPLAHVNHVVGALLCVREKQLFTEAELNELRQISLLLGPVLEVRRERERSLSRHCCHILSRLVGRFWAAIT